MKWKSNAKFGIDECKGTIFELKDFPYQVAIHKFVGYGENFYLTCNTLGLHDFSLHTESFDKAVRIARDIIKDKLNTLNSAFAVVLADTAAPEIVRY